jgi:hypothetical protein
VIFPWLRFVAAMEFHVGSVLLTVAIALEGVLMGIECAGLARTIQPTRIDILICNPTQRLNGCECS